MTDVGLQRPASPEYIQQVLRLEAVACKDWLTNKVDRCVGGRVAKQQCAGPLQLPLNDCGVMALGFDTQQASLLPLAMPHQCV
jgi:phosphoribosylformylglycinamidine synthase